MNTATEQDAKIPVEEQLAALIPLNAETIDCIGEHLRQQFDVDTSHGKYSGDGSPNGKLRDSIMNRAGTEQVYIFCVDRDLATDIPGAVYLPESINSDCNPDALEEACQAAMGRFDKNSPAGHTLIASEYTGINYRRSLKLAWFVLTVPYVSSLKFAADMLMKRDKKGCVDISACYLDRHWGYSFEGDLSDATSESYECFTVRESSERMKPSADYFDPSNAPCELNPFFNRHHVLFFDPARPKRRAASRKAAETRRKRQGTITMGEIQEMGHIMVMTLQSSVFSCLNVDWCSGNYKSTMVCRLIELYAGMKRANLLGEIRKYERRYHYGNEKKMKPSERPWYRSIKQIADRIEAFENQPQKNNCDLTPEQRKEFGKMVRAEARAMRIRIPESGETK